MLRVAMKMLLGDRAKYVGLLFGITFTSFLVTFAALLPLRFYDARICSCRREPECGRMGDGPGSGIHGINDEYSRFGALPRSQCRRRCVRRAAGAGDSGRALSQRAISVISTHRRG